MERLQRAIGDTGSLRDLRLDLARAFFTALVTLPLFGFADWPHGALGVWFGLLTVIGGFLIVMVGEFGFNWLLADGRLARDELDALQPELAALRANEQDVAGLRDQQQKQDAAYHEQIAAVRTEAALNAAHLKVLWEVVREQNGGIDVPLPAIVARMNIHTQVITQNFD